MRRGGSPDAGRRRRPGIDSYAAQGADIVDAPDEALFVRPPQSDRNIAHHPSQPTLSSTSIGPAVIEQDDDDDDDNVVEAAVVDEPQHRGFISSSSHHRQGDNAPPPTASTSSCARPVAVRVIRPTPRRSSKPAEAAPTPTNDPPANPTTFTTSLSVAQTIKAGVATSEAVLRQVTVPQEAASAFYDSAYTEGLSGPEVHHAVLLSHEWHRKWTHQNETGHGYHESLARDRRHNSLESHHQHHPAVPSVALQPYLQSHEMMITGSSNHKNHRSSSSFSTPSPPAPTSDAMELFDRYAGAKNPSPEDLDAEPRKRVRSALREQQQRTTATTSPFGPLAGLPPPFGLSSTNGPVRPVALRIPRPSALRVGPSFQHQEVGPAWTQLVPQDIFDDMLLYRRDDNEEDEGSNASQYGSNHHHRRHHHHRDHRRSSPRAMSPLTVTSSSGGSVKGEASPTGGATTHEQPNQQHRVVHFIEPDQESVKSVMSSSSSLSSLSGMHRPAPIRSVRLAIREARDGLLEALAGTGGNVVTATPDAVTDKFHQCLAVLEEHGASHFASEEGMWLSLTAPNYFGSLGENDECDPRYTLGRMAFDMFSPTSLICSLQGNFNSVERVSDEERAAMLLHVPKALQDEVMANTSVLRTYNIVAAFTIEPPSEEFPDAPNRDVHRPIRGIMTTYGYTLPDPDVPHRLSIWITGGRIEPNGSPEDVENWKHQFELHPAVHSLGEKAKLLAVKMLMGAHLHPMEADGSMEYTFTRPLGGHGIAYVDTLYCDKSLRIVRGHRGTVFVFTRLPDAPTQKN